MIVFQTRACDLSTILAVKTKRTLLLALHNKNLPYDEEKNRIIYEKYKQYLIPVSRYNHGEYTFF